MKGHTIRRNIRMPHPPAPPALATICLPCFYSLSSPGELGRWAGKRFSALRLPTPTAKAWKICWLYFWREARQEWFLVFYHSTCYHKDGSSSDVRIQVSVLFWFLLPLDTPVSHLVSRFIQPLLEDLRAQGRKQDADFWSVWTVTSFWCNVVNSLGSREQWMWCIEVLFPP